MSSTPICEPTHRHNYDSTQPINTAEDAQSILRGFRCNMLSVEICGLSAEKIRTKGKSRPATGRLLLFQGRIVPTEAVKFRRNFLPKSYGPKKGSVKPIFAK
jgi:hypothetical protein